MPESSQRFYTAAADEARLVVRPLATAYPRKPLPAERKNSLGLVDLFILLVVGTLLCFVPVAYVVLLGLWAIVWGVRIYRWIAARVRGKGRSLA